MASKHMRLSQAKRMDESGCSMYQRQSDGKLARLAFDVMVQMNSQNFASSTVPLLELICCSARKCCRAALTLVRPQHTRRH